MCVRVQVGKDVYECSYNPSDAGSLSVSVLYDGQPVSQSPYQVSVAPVSRCPVKAFGAGLVDAVAGFPATFTVLTNDEPGTLGRSSVCHDDDDDDDDGVFKSVTDETVDVDSWCRLMG